MKERDSQDGSGAVVPKAFRYVGARIVDTTHRRLLAGVLAGCMAPGAVVAAQCTLGKMTPADPVLDSSFGAAMAMHADLLVVGAPDSWAGSVVQGGAADVYRRIGGDWTFEARLVPPDPEVQSDFGNTLAVYGDTVLVGAARKDDFGGDSGAVYGFRRILGQWQFEQKLLLPESLNSAVHGRALALAGDLAVVSAPNHHWAGVVSVYKRQGSVWTLVQSIPSPDQVNWIDFGSALVLQDPFLYAAARFDSHPLPGNGNVYVYKWSGSAFVPQGPVPWHSQIGDWFGTSVAQQGDLLVVGAPGRDHPEFEDAGMVNVFRKLDGNWIFEAKLESGDPNYLGSFGQCVSVAGNVIAVGEMRDAVAPDTLFSGAVWRFDYVDSAWVRRPKLVALDNFEKEELGTSVLVDGDDILGGAPFDSPDTSPAPGGGPASGAVYSFRGAPAWTDIGQSLSLSLPVPRLSAAGTLQPLTPVSLFLQHGKGTSAHLVIGLLPMELPFKGGVMVPSPDALIPALPLAANGSLCVEGEVPATLPAGLALYIQFWMTEAAAPQGFAASNALQGVVP